MDGGNGFAQRNRVTKKNVLVLLCCLVSLCISVPSVTYVLVAGERLAQADRVEIRVDAGKARGEMKPVWAFFGYDEPNYTYMKDGRKLLSELAALSPVPVFVRAHTLLTPAMGRRRSSGARPTPTPRTRPERRTTTGRPSIESSIPISSGR